MKQRNPDENELCDIDVNKISSRKEVGDIILVTDLNRQRKEARLSPPKLKRETEKRNNQRSNVEQKHSKELWNVLVGGGYFFLCLLILLFLVTSIAVLFEILL